MVKSLLQLACCCMLAAPAFSGQAPAGQTAATQAKRLYVEPFTTKADAKKLRDDLIAELRKLPSVSLVLDESKADLILAGGGEVWVKGYRSFSPRSELKLPSNGTPIYGGFMSVELRNKEGVTRWSYLATPGPESTDVFKDLSKRITKQLSEELARPDTPIAAGILQITTPQATVALHGAGATFPYPVYAKWFTNYKIANPGAQITYDAIGSEAGLRQLLARGVDFSASDSPEGIQEIAPAEDDQYLFFPSVVGAVVPIVNLPGFPDGVSLSPEALAGIYLGKITKWNDPVLKQGNHGLDLPDLDIVVVHRSDGSGTSYAWTSYLSQTNPEWKMLVGAGLQPKWPVGKTATGNEGVAALVKELGGSIGYVEFIYALQKHLNYAKVRNQNGEFIEASLESIGAAVSHVMEIGSDLNVSVVNAPGAGSYPIASFTWLVVPAHIDDAAKRNAVTVLLRWMLGPGQRQAAALGYLPLPKAVLSREQDLIAQIH
jgi:phosphate transport system substrate-binding protein